MGETMQNEKIFEEPLYIWRYLIGETMQKPKSEDIWQNFFSVGQVTCPSSLPHGIALLWKIFFFQLLLKYAGQQNMNLMIATKLFQQDSHYWVNPLLAAWFWRAARLPVEAKMWECFGAAGFCQAYHSAQKIQELTFIRSILWVHACS